MSVSVTDILQLAEKAGAVVLKPLTSSPLFFIFMFLLGCACFQMELPTAKGAYIYEYVSEELFVDLYLLCTLLAIMPQSLRKWVRRLLYVVMYVVTIVDVYCFERFHTSITPTMLLLLGETNSNEASEFLSSYLTIDVLWGKVGIVLAIMIVNAALAVWGGRIRRLFMPFAEWRPLIVVASSIVVAATLIDCTIRALPNKQAVARLWACHDIGEVEHALTGDHKAVHYLPVYRLAFSIYANMLASQQTDRLIQGIDKVTIDSCSYTSTNIILVIGESYNRHHSQLYDYPLPTTPRQLAWQKRGNLTAFTDVVAPWNLTSFVFKNIFSLHGVGDKGAWCDYPLFPQLFRKAGYKVTFITNQFLPRAKEAVYDFSGGFFLNNPLLSKSQFDIRNNSLHPYDDGVIKDFDQLTSLGIHPSDTIDDDAREHVGATDSVGHNLVILHFMGQHVTYHDRYPKKQKPFTFRNYPERKLSKRDKMILADYDNATLYNDSVIGLLLDRLANKDAIVIYVPDHAEECFGDDKSLFGRLHSSEVDYRLAKEEFEIPFWIWCSPAYRQSHPDIFQMIKAAADRPFMTDDLSHLLLYLAGIHCPEYRDSRNILSPSFNMSRRRLIKDHFDYDQLRLESKKESKQLSKQESSNLSSKRAKQVTKKR